MLLAIPALRVLARASPRGTLALAAQARISRLLETLGVVNRAVDFESLGLDALFEAEAGGRPRQWPARCAEVLRHATRVVAWIGSREPLFVERLTALAPGSIVAASVGSGRPVWEHLVATLGATGALGAAEAGGDHALRAPVGVPATLVDEARRELVGHGWNERDRLLLVHPGAGGTGKRWTSAGFAAVLERVAALPAVAVVLHQGPSDSAAIAALPKHVTAHAIRLREPPLPLLAGTLTLVAAYLGNDSGISHLAAATGTPAVVLFGAERLIWRPWALHVEPQVVSLAAEEESDIERVASAVTALLR